MSELPRHRSRPRRSLRYVAAPVAAALLAGLAAVPAFLPGGGEDLVVRMDDARRAATAAGKAAALRPAIVDADEPPPAPSPVAAGPNLAESATPTFASETPQDSQSSAETKAAPTEREASPTERPASTSASRSSAVPSTTTSSPTESQEADPPSSAPPPEQPSTTQSGRSTQSSSGEKAAEAEVLDIVNAERASAGCGPVAHDSGLAQLAGDYSADMAERGFFSHTDPDGRDPWDRARDAGIDYLRAENIARGQPTPASVMSSWMDSAGHRANILNCEYTKLGVGVHFASGGPWWTQSFGV